MITHRCSTCPIDIVIYRHKDTGRWVSYDCKDGTDDYSGHDTCPFCGIKLDESTII